MHGREFADDAKYQARGGRTLSYCRHSHHRFTDGIALAPTSPSPLCSSSSFIFHPSRSPSPLVPSSSVLGGSAHVHNLGPDVGGRAWEGRGGPLDVILVGGRRHASFVVGARRLASPIPYPLWVCGLCVLLCCWEALLFVGVAPGCRAKCR
eukprot:scaffold133734_cov25-Tisochrysis_lutea.AAC.2